MVLTLTGTSPQPLRGGMCPLAFRLLTQAPSPEGQPPFRLWPPLTCDPVTRYAVAGPLCRGPHADVAQALLPSMGGGILWLLANTARGRVQHPGASAPPAALPSRGLPGQGRRCSDNARVAGWGQPGLGRCRFLLTPVLPVPRKRRRWGNDTVWGEHGSEGTPTGMLACSRGRRGQGAIAHRASHGLRSDGGSRKAERQAGPP